MAPRDRRGSFRLMVRGFSSVLRAATAAVLVVAATSACGAAAVAADIAPHRALYSMTLGSSKNDSGVASASGTMAYQWGETCDGWTVEQRYRLKMGYAEQQDVEIASNFVTWESKDGLHYRFNQKETRNGTGSDEIHGEAQFDAGKGGTADFTKPEPKKIDLPAGTLFPSAQTVLVFYTGVSGGDLSSRPRSDWGTPAFSDLGVAVIRAKDLAASAR